MNYRPTWFDDAEGANEVVLTIPETGTVWHIDMGGDVPKGEQVSLFHGADASAVNPHGSCYLVVYADGREIWTTHSAEYAVELLRKRVVVEDVDPDEIQEAA